MKLLKYQNAKLRDQFIFTLPASKEVCGRSEVFKHNYAMIHNINAKGE